MNEWCKFIRERVRYTRNITAGRTTGVFFFLFCFFAQIHDVLVCSQSLTDVKQNFKRIGHGLLFFLLLLWMCRSDKLPCSWWDMEPLQCSALPLVAFSCLLHAAGGSSSRQQPHTSTPRPLTESTASTCREVGGKRFHRLRIKPWLGTGIVHKTKARTIVHHWGPGNSTLKLALLLRNECSLINCFWHGVFLFHSSCGLQWAWVFTLIQVGAWGRIERQSTFIGCCGVRCTCFSLCLPGKPHKASDWDQRSASALGSLGTQQTMYSGV